MGHSQPLTVSSSRSGCCCPEAGCWLLPTTPRLSSDLTAPCPPISPGSQHPHRRRTRRVPAFSEAPAPARVHTQHTSSLPRQIAPLFPNGKTEGQGDPERPGSQQLPAEQGPRASCCRARAPSAAVASPPPAAVQLQSQRSRRRTWAVFARRAEASARTGCPAGVQAPGREAAGDYRGRVSSALFLLGLHQRRFPNPARARLRFRDELSGRSTGSASREQLFVLTPAPLPSDTAGGAGGRG